MAGAGEHAAPISLGNLDDNSFRGTGLAVQRAQATLERGQDVRVTTADVERAREAVREQLLDEHHPLGRDRTVELGQARRKREDKLEVRPHGAPIQRHCADKRRVQELPGEALQRPGEDPATPRAGELRSAPHEKRRLWMHLHAGAQQAVCLPPKQRAVSSARHPAATTTPTAGGTTAVAANANAGNDAMRSGAAASSGRGTLNSRPCPSLWRPVRPMPRS